MTLSDNPSVQSVFTRTAVSVGICCFNEEANIGSLLENLLDEQGLSPQSEVFVVCSGCTDRTPAIVQQYVIQDSRVHMLLEAKRTGKVAAINAILQRCTTPYLFLIPGDVQPAPYTLYRLFNALYSDAQTGVVCGRPVPINHNTGFSGYLSHLIWRLHHRTLAILNEHNLSSHATGEFMAIKHHLIKALPQTVINEDAYIALTAIAKNYRVTYCPDALVYIKAPAHIPDYIRQRRRIIVGHHHLKHLMHQYPRTLKNMLFFDPKTSLTIVKSELTQYPTQIPKFGFAILIEALATAVALIDLVFRKNHVVWRIATSTKTMINPRQLVTRARTPE